MFDFEGRTLTPERAQLYIDKGFWTEESFVDVFYNDVQQYPNFVHRDEEREATYAQLWNEIEAVAANLYEMGVRKGDTVALQLPNALDYVVGVFAAARIGAIGVSLQIDLGRQAIHSSLQTSKAKVWIIADHFRGQPLYEMAEEIAADLPALKQVVLQGDPERAPEGAVTFASLRS